MTRSATASTTTPAPAIAASRASLAPGPSATAPEHTMGGVEGDRSIAIGTRKPATTSKPAARRAGGGPLGGAGRPLDHDQRLARRAGGWSGHGVSGWADQAGAGDAA